MNIRMKLLISIIFLSSLLCRSVYAVGYSIEGKITGMYTGANNILGIFHSGTWFNPANCPIGAADKAYLIDYTSTADWSKVTSMLLTAYTANKAIRIGVVPDRCYEGYPIILRVAFIKGI